MKKSEAFSKKIAMLDELRLLVIIDNETDGLSSVSANVPQVSEITHLTANLPVVSEYHGHPCKAVLDWFFCAACMGLSVLVTGRRGTKKHVMLFDVGPFADVWLSNASRLGVDLSEIEVIFLSHWHSDHSGALPKIILAITEARRRNGITTPVVVDVHPDRPDRRGILLPTGTMMLLPPEPSFADLEAAGGQVVKHTESHGVCNDFFFASGEINRVTSYERGLVGHYSFRGATGAEDPLILDERFLAAQVRGRGVTVLSACSHAGIVNTALDAQARFGGAPIDVLFGGYHLSGKAMELRINDTLRDLQERIRPRIVAPGHCTGWRAKTALAQAFAPDHYGPSLAGSSYVLPASVSRVKKKSKN